MRREYFIPVYYSQFPYRDENGFASLQWQIHSHPPLQKNGLPPHSGKSILTPIHSGKPILPPLGKREGGTLGN